MISYSPVHVQGVLRCQLVAGTNDEFELVHRDAEADEQSFEHERIVFDPPFDRLQR